MYIIAQEAEVLILEFRNILFTPGSYDYRIHRGIARFARGHNWHLIADTARGASIPIGWNGNGIITSLPAHQEELKFLVNHTKVPIVDLRLTNINKKHVQHVVLDNIEIGKKGARYFLSLGFQNFFWISYSLGPQQKLRLAGYEKTINDAGFQCDKLFWDVSYEKSWKRQVKEVQAKLQKALKPLAVLAHNDYIAANIIDACLLMDAKVPEEIAVLGVENNELVVESLAVPLSSIDVNFEELGFQAAARLEAVLNGDPQSKEPILIKPGEIIVRKSTDVIAVNNDLVVEAIHFIRNNFATNIGVADVVETSGVSRRTLENLFKKHLKRSVNEEIIQTRLNKVKELLNESELSIEEIALHSGFTRANYLHQLFKKRFKVTPKQYRDGI